MDHQIHDEASEQNHVGISTFQDQTLSILPIPSAFLSVLGSSVILYVAFSSKRQRKWTTYTRLLIGLSICDIITSVSLGLAPFMRRPQSERAWAFGNDATCTATGTMLQFSSSNLFYNAMLSFYFLATVRFGVKHTVIAKRYEPFMHFVSLGYPLVTAIVGATMGMYAESALGVGCWVNEYPRGCGDGPGQETCISGLIGSIFFGLPYIFALASIDINNLLIWFYVRKQRKPLQKTRRVWRTASSDCANMSVDREDLSVKRKTSDESLVEELASIVNETPVFDGIVTDPDDTIIACNSTNAHPSKYTPSDIDQSDRETRATKDQMRRLQLVSSQAFLFVLAYALSSAWGGMMAIAESSTSTENEANLMSNIYGLMVMNAIFAPLQGFLNMLVYMRPKYIKARHQFPRETRTWAFRRAVLGDGVRPDQRPPQQKKKEPAVDTVSNSGTPEKHQVVSGSPPTNNMPISNGMDCTQHIVPLPKSTMVSSLTASLGDFDAGRDDEGKKSKPELERTKGAFEASSTLPRFHFRSSLEQMGRNLQAISELTESVFDPIMHLPSDDEETDDEDDSIRSTDTDPLEQSERRWYSSAANASPTATVSGRSVLVEEYRKDETVIQSPMGLVAPRRMDSDYEIMFDEESDGIIEEEICEEEGLEFVCELDKPVSIPLRRMSLSRSLDSRSFHSISSSISSSCSLISFSEEDLEFGDDDGDFYEYPCGYEEEKSYEENEDPSQRSSDTPIRAPRRKLSPSFPENYVSESNYGAEPLVT